MSLSTVGQSVFVLDAFARFSSDCRSFHTFSYTVSSFRLSSCQGQISFTVWIYLRGSE